MHARRAAGDVWLSVRLKPYRAHVIQDCLFDCTVIYIYIYIVYLTLSAPTLVRLGSLVLKSVSHDLFCDLGDGSTRPYRLHRIQDCPFGCTVISKARILIPMVPSARIT